MTALLFLLSVVALSLLGALMLWLRERGPRSMEAHMREFERQLEALSPEFPLQRGGNGQRSRPKGRRSG